MKIGCKKIRILIMTPKQWFALLAFYISYLFLGASIFYYMEQYLETQRRLAALRDQKQINGKLVELAKKYGLLLINNYRFTFKIIQTDGRKPTIKYHGSNIQLL